MPIPEAFFETLRAALGAEHVVVDPAALAEAMRATFATRATIPAIVRPSSREGVQACLAAANRFGVRLYPTSRGRNWGLARASPRRTAACCSTSAA